MGYTTITAGTIGIADGDQNPSPVDGTVRITPRFPSAATTDGLIATGPVIVEVVGGAMPKTDIPALTDATAKVEFHLYDRNAGPVHLPATEIPLEPSTTINLRDYLAVAVDPASGGTIIRGPRGRGITAVSGSNGNIIIEWEDGAEPAVIPMPDAVPGPPGKDGKPGADGKQGPEGRPGSVELTGVTPEIVVGETYVHVGGKPVALEAVRPPAVGMNANSIDQNITYSLADLDGVINLPDGVPGGGVLETFVLNPSGGRPKLQRFTTTTPATMSIRFSGGSTWSAWTRLDATEAVKFNSSPAADLNSVGAGRVASFAAWADTKNIPPAAGTSGAVVSLGATNDNTLMQLALTYGNSRELWARHGSNTSFQPWTRLDAGAINPDDFYNYQPTPAGFRLVPVALTVGGGTSATWHATEGGVRIPVKIGAEVTRYRIHLRNINPRDGKPGTGTVQVPNIYIGKHLGGGQVDGAYARIGGGYESDGGEMVTSWVNAPIEAGVEYLLAYEWSSTASPRSVVGGGWTTDTRSETTSNSAETPRRSSLPLDVWIEAEVAHTSPVVAVFGDSIASGTGADLPVYNSWLSQWCRANAAIPVHYSAHGDSMSGWADTEQYKWQRWQHLDRPDAVIHAMGSNDVFAGTSESELRNLHTSSVESLRSLVSGAVYSATILPRNSSTGADEDARRSFNLWLKTTPNEARDAFDFVPAVSDDDETIRTALTGDGTHPNTDGYGLMASAVNRPIVAPAASRDEVQARLSALETALL